MDRVLKAVLLPVNPLRPLGLLLRAEDPAAEVLGLYDENPERRDHDMIDLGRSLSIGAGQVEIVKGMVGFGLET